MRSTSEAREEDGGTAVPIACDHDIVVARRQGRAFVLRLGFSLAEAMLIATAVSELARNILLYAERGEILLRTVEQAGKAGVVVIARDTGPGIPDVREATADEASLRLGLRGLKQLMDEFEIASRRGAGTTVTVKKWKS